METLINCLLQIALGFGGIMITILFMVQDYIKDGVFDKKVFLCKHRIAMIVSMMLITILAVIVNVAPEAGEALKALTTMDVSTAPHSFVFLATAVYSTIYSKSRSDARSKDRKE